MAITKSAKGALRQSQRKRVQNLQKEKKLKNLLKEVKNLITQAQAKREDEQGSSSLEKKVEKAKKLLPQVFKSLDKAAKTGLIKSRTAARKKSRIAKAINKSQ